MGHPNSPRLAKLVPPALSWSYDAWGNRTAQTPTGGTCNYSSLGFDSNNHINSPSGYTYDADGNLTFDGTHHYYYDGENQLIQVDGTPGTCSSATACYVYDANGRRAQKITGASATNYLYDLSGHVVTEDSGSMWLRGYVYAGGQLIAEYENATTYFVHDNNIGTSTILSNMAGGISPGDCNALYPFGEQDNTICSTSNLTTHKFTGKERDTESNLDNFGARYYSSAQGRFMTADWSAIPAPVPYADLHNPQTLNLYAYVGNNPLGKVDPDGHGEQDAQTTTKPEGNGEAPDTAGAAAATGADKKQQPQASQASVVTMALPLLGRAVAGATEGAEAGTTAGTVEPGGGNLVGAVVGAVVGGAVAALAPTVYTKTKDAAQKVGGYILTAADHLKKLATSPDQDPRNKWKDTIRRTANSIDQQADRISNKTLRTAARFVAEGLRDLVQ